MKVMLKLYVTDYCSCSSAIVDTQVGTLIAICDLSQCRYIITFTACVAATNVNMVLSPLHASISVKFNCSFQKLLSFCYVQRKV